MLTNPFPNPETIDKELNIQVKQIIINLFNNNGSINFHDLVTQIEDAVSSKNYTLAKIISYYCTNAIINEPSLSLSEKNDIINGIYREVIIAENAEKIDTNNISNVSDVL